MLITASPSYIITPTITVSGFAIGNTVNLYSDSLCSTILASGAANGLMVDLVSSALVNGTYAFYANTSDPSGNYSSCSTVYVNYVVNTTAEAVS